MRSLDAQKQLLDRTLVAYQKALDLNQNRFAGGLTSGAEVAQARTQLETTRAQSIEVGVERAQFEHAIAVLAGRTPESLSLAEAPLASTPPPIPTGVPSQLLERRPDIASTERRVAEANQRIGIAQAAFFPTLLITATGGYQSRIHHQLVQLAQPILGRRTGSSANSVRCRPPPRGLRGGGRRLRCHGSRLPGDDAPGLPRGGG